MVRATAHLTNPAAPPDPDTAILLLDADLAVRGAGEARSRRSTADVRREYGFVPGDDYHKGRPAVLERFLARPRIYHHPLMVTDLYRRAAMGGSRRPYHSTFVRGQECHTSNSPRVAIWQPSPFG